MADCACGQELPEWFKQAAKCHGCGGDTFSGGTYDQTWLKIGGVCTPFHKACVPEKANADTGTSGH